VCVYIRFRSVCVKGVGVGSLWNKKDSRKNTNKNKELIR